MYQKSFTSSYGLYLTLFSSIALGAFALHYPIETGSLFSQLLNPEVLWNIISGIYYIGGIGYAIKSFLCFDKHNENPKLMPLSVPVTLAIVSALLFFLPIIMTTVTGVNFDTSIEHSHSTTGELNTIE